MSGNYSQPQISFGPSITPGVKWLIIINVVVFLMQLISASLGAGISSPLEDLLAHNNDYINRGYIWQLFTYQFLHFRGSYFHLIFNMYALWVFGSELEAKWGRKEFIRFYLYSGTGAGIIIYILPVLLGQKAGTTIGASGAIFGVMLAYALTWPNRVLMLMMVFPVKVKYYVLGLGVMSLVLTLNITNSRISHVGHLGGLITAYLYIVLRLSRDSHRFQKSTLMHKWKMTKQRKLWKQQQKKQETQIDIYDDKVSIEEKVDKILGKISQSGMKSLSNDEKRFLREASSKMNTPTPKDSKNRGNFH